MIPEGWACTHAEKYELADPDSFSVLYPAYIRGLAYLQMHEGRLAAAEFEKCSLIRVWWEQLSLERCHACSWPGRRE